MAFSNTFVTLDDVSTNDLATVPGQVVVVSNDGSSLDTVANTSLQGDAFRTLRNQTDNSIIIADQREDVLTYIAGTGIDIAFNEGLDTITWSVDGVAGYTGSQGAKGDTGDTGFNGSAGPQGFTGSRGIQGYTGSQGFDGSMGFQGSAGVRGYTGSRGFVGSTGEDGVRGFDGSVGFSGSRGFQGPIGFSGSAGFTGSIGFSGSQGDIGNTGFAGSAGFAGSRGFVGSQGLFGYTGSTGATGLQGNAGVMGYTGSQGDTGLQGFQGSAGFQGSQGFDGSVGFTGSRGLLGYSGSRGFTGSQGAQGLLGPQGPSGFTGSDGLVGFTGSQAISWRTFRVVGQDNVIADQEEDVIEFIAGPGMTITTDTALDTITFTTDGVANILADIAVVENTPTGNVSRLEYDDAGTFTFTSASADDIVAAANIDLSNYYTKSETYSKVETDALIANVDANVDLTNYYTKPETNALLATKMSSFTVTNGSTLFTVTDSETVNLLGTAGQINNTLDTINQSVTWSLSDELELNNVSINGTLFSNDITSTGNVVIEGQNTVITGNLSVLGNTTIINSNTVQTGDTIITLNANMPSTQPPTQNLGLEGNRGTEANVYMIWDEAADVWTVQGETFVAGKFVGDIDLSGNSIVDLNDVEVSGLADGEILVWDAGNATWTNSDVDVSGDIASLQANVTQLQTDVTVLQGNVVTIEAELANIADTDAQTLSWDGTSELSISNGNTVDLAGLGDQSLSLNTSSNVLSITDGNSVDFTPILGGGGGGTTTIERLKVNYDSGGAITSISDATSGISSTTIVDAATGLIQFNLDTGTYSFPYAQLTFFGYDQPNDRYVVTAVPESNTTRFLDGDSGNLFDGTPSAITTDLLANKASTFSSAGFGQATHAWIQITCTTV